jgi:hypothetical protein
MNSKKKFKEKKEKEKRKRSTCSRWASKNDYLLRDQLHPELLLLLLKFWFFELFFRLVDIWHAHISSLHACMHVHGRKLIFGTMDECGPFQQHDDAIKHTN